MENLNIPIYRGLKLGTKDEYVEGHYNQREDYTLDKHGEEVIVERHFITKGMDNQYTDDDCFYHFHGDFEIDESTLSISFEDMKVVKELKSLLHLVQVVGVEAFLNLKEKHMWLFLILTYQLTHLK